jgi:phasin
MPNGQLVPKIYERQLSMADVSSATAKSKAKPGAPTGATFENAFMNDTIEAPAAFREFAEKGISQAKDNYEKLKSVAEEASGVIETACSSATKGATDYGLKLIDSARTNTNATFDYFAELVTAKSPSEVVELSTTHARKHFEAFTTQMHELTELAQKVMTGTTEPLRDGVTRMVKKVG